MFVFPGYRYVQEAADRSDLTTTVHGWTYTRCMAYLWKQHWKV